MQRLFLALLVFGVLAGLGERVLAQVGAIHWHVAAVEDCCHDHPAPPEEGHHDPDCPPGPHHHHSAACCGGLLVMEEPVVCRLCVAPGLRTAWHHPDVAVPDGPVFPMDKPPLI